MASDFIPLLYKDWSYIKMEIKYLKSSIKGLKIAVVGCLHGDELIGQKIINQLNRLHIKKGVLTTIIANTDAIKKNKRFLDIDLNRSFPGEKNGNKEERMAYQLIKTLKDCDLVIDIHSTTTDTKSLIVVTKLNKKINSYINIVSPKRVALMPKKFAKHSMNFNVKNCLSFEYGKDNSKKAYNEALNHILNTLIYFQMIDGKFKSVKNKTDFYKIKDVIKKPTGFKLKNINNFQLVKKGQVIAKNKNELIKSKKSFYPILFGDKAYQDIFGFMAEKL